MLTPRKEVEQIIHKQDVGQDDLNWESGSEKPLGPVELDREGGFPCGRH